MAVNNRIYLDPSFYGGRKIIGYLLLTTFLINGGLKFSKYLNTGELQGLILSIFLFLFSTLYIVHLTYPEVFRPASIKVTSDSIDIGKKPFGKKLIIPWRDINETTIGSYELNFLLKEHQIQWNYKNDSNLSLQIKSLVREEASEKGITISPST